MDITTTCWLYDVPLLSRHPLTEEMRAQLRQDARRSIVWGVLLLTAIPLVCIILVPLLFILEEYITFPDIYGVYWATFMFIGALMAISLGIFCLQRAWWSRRDLLAGEFMRFSGPVNDSLLEIPEIEGMMHVGLINVGDSNISLDVLGHTKRLWMVNDRPVRNRRVVKLVHTAPQPESARIAEQWPELIEEIDGKVVQGNHRELSAEEIAEIGKYALKQWLSPLPFALALSLWCGVVIYAAALQGKFSFQLMFFALLLLTIVCDFALVHGITIAIKLRRDRKLGEVIIMRGEGLSPQSDDQSVGDVKTYEVLPNSQMVWTVDGRPSSWRTR